MTTKLETPTSTSPPGPTVIKTCKTCAHLNVCSLYRAISPLLESWKEQKTRPFETEELAMICKQFLPNSITTLLSSLEAPQQ